MTKREPDDRIEFAGVTVERHGARIVWQRTPGSDSDELRQFLVARAEAEAGRGDSIAAELLGILSSCNPLHLLGQVVLIETASIGGIDQDDRFGAEARIEYLAGLVLRSPEPVELQELARPDQVAETIQLVRELFDIRSRRILAEEVADDAGGEELSKARYLLRIENLLYRSQGYPPHLRIIAERLFAPLRDQFVEAIGFCPADLPNVLDAIWRQSLEIIDQCTTETEMIRRQPLDPPPTAFELFSWLIFKAGLLANRATVDEIAIAANMDSTELSAMLIAMSAQWGSQPEFDDPEGPNVIRRYPWIPVGPGRFFVANLWGGLAELIPWFKDFKTREGLEDLWEVYLDHRGQAVEAMVADAMASIFGEDRVYRNLEYPISGGNWAELDVLVELPGQAIVIEAKSGNIHDATRRGDVGFVERTIEDLADVPFHQSHRAAEYLLAGGNRFRRSDGQTLEIGRVQSVCRVAVSLERVDPIALDASRYGEEPATWLVALGDLLAIADLLPEAISFTTYAQLREVIATNPRAIALAEVDFLGAFLSDRMEAFFEMMADESFQMIMPMDYAHVVDDYFVPLALGMDPPRPRTPFPDAFDPNTIASVLAEGDETAWNDAVRRLRPDSPLSCDDHSGPR